MQTYFMLFASYFIENEKNVYFVIWQYAKIMPYAVRNIKGSEQYARVRGLSIKPYSSVSTPARVVWVTIARMLPAGLYGRRLLQRMVGRSECHLHHAERRMRLCTRQHVCVVDELETTLRFTPLVWFKHRGNIDDVFSSLTLKSARYLKYSVKTRKWIK